jgi:uncharacterized protein YlxW (UPF0749 family)
MPDSLASEDQKTQIALLVQHNRALTKRVEKLEQKVDQDEKTIAEFVSAARTGKWALGTLVAFGSLVAAIVAIVLSRGGQP